MTKRRKLLIIVLMALISYAAGWVSIKTYQINQRQEATRLQWEIAKKQLEEKLKELKSIRTALEEAHKQHKLEQEVFDDIINNKMSIHHGFTHISEPLPLWRSETRIKY